MRRRCYKIKEKSQVEIYSWKVAEKYQRNRRYVCCESWMTNSEIINGENKDEGVGWETKEGKQCPTGDEK